MRARSTFFFAVLAALPLVAPIFAGDGPAVIVPLNVDVYAEPGGVGTPVGMIAGGTQVNLVEDRDDHWCEVYGPRVPNNGRGWIWSGKGDDRQNYSVKAVEDKPVVELVCPQDQVMVMSGAKTICQAEMTDGAFVCSKASVKDGKLSYEPIACHEP
jgi:hypothetical protein